MRGVSNVDQHTRNRARDHDDEEAASCLDDHRQYAGLRDRGACDIGRKYTFDVKVLATGAKFRVSPTRDPQQPRFWCISVRQCSSVAMPDPASPIWIDRPGIPWAEMPDTIETIRADVASWLVVPDRAALCQWLMTAAPAPTAAVMVEAESNRRRTTARASR